MNTPDFRIIIAGSRTFNDYNKLATHCDRLLAEKKKTHHIVIVSGTCRGADLMGERYAQEHGYSIARYPADWNRLGKFAGIQRNLIMANNADALIAFWDGQSHGTKAMIEFAREKNLAVRVVSC